MSQLVYVQSMPPEPVQYFTPKPVHPAPLQQIAFLYPTSSQSVPPPQQPQQQQQQHFQPQFSPNGASYYICQNSPMEVNNSGSNFVYLVPSTPTSGPGQMSMFIQSSNSSCSGISTNQPINGCDMYAAPQVVVPSPNQPQQQQQQMSYIPMPAAAASLKPPQSMFDPSTKLALLRSPEVCRHYLNGRCNRRKCRFLHPDLQHPVGPAVMTYIATDPSIPALSRTLLSTTNTPRARAASSRP